MTKETFIKQETLFKEKTGEDFTTVYKKYYPKLISYTTEICKDRGVAEDISTDSFILALEEIKHYDKEKINFSTWLFNITKELIRNR